jgi:LacI family transcriptional regulator
MATIYDVAKVAKVSPSTVSRIINGERNVAPATAEVVEAAIKKVGYVQRAVRPGRKPVKRQGVQTGMIDFLSLGAFSPAQMFSLPAFSKLLDGVMRTVEGEGMDLVLSQCPHGKVIPPVLARRRADGVVLFGSPSLYPKVAKVLERIPSVWCFIVEPPGGLKSDYVFYDNEPVGRMAADYLLDRGHRHLAVMSTTAGHHAFIERGKTFFRALAEQGLSAATLECLAKPPFPDVAVRAEPLIDQLLALTPRPTGVFCVSDDLMLAVFNGLRRRGIEPGRDIELIGCNNDGLRMEQMHPRPATIDLKLDQVGRLAVKKLLWKMSHPDDGEIPGILVSPELIPPE